MSPNDAGSLLGTLIGSVLGLVFLAGLIAVMLAGPFLVFSAVRSLRRIAAALERMNDTRAVPSPALNGEPEVGPWKPRVNAAQSPASTQSPFP